MIYGMRVFFHERDNQMLSEYSKLQAVDGIELSIVELLRIDSGHQEIEIFQKS
jgi:hypothetical protein